MWLSGRQQRVTLNISTSGWKDVISGVPQGWVLDLLLFILFVNTPDNNVDSKVLKIAEDIKLFSYMYYTRGLRAGSPSV